MLLFRTALLLLCILTTFSYTSCDRGHSPLPRGYFRIDLPEKNYRAFDTLFPYTFQYPEYAKILPDTRPSAEPYWADMIFPDFGASLHLSYKTIQHEDELHAYTEDGRNFLNRHIPKATGFQERIFSHEENNVHGILYEISGREAASPMQFYLTDSTRHFLRGAVYFNVTPNNDSLAPVIRFISDDIRVFMESLQWKDL